MSIRSGDIVTSMSAAHVLVPVKRLDHAKSRLAATLSRRERGELVREMLGAVLEAVREAEVGPVTVVSAEPLDLNGVPRFDDSGLSWNDALAAAAREVVAEPIVAVVAADLPLLQAAEVRELVAATPKRGLAIARAKDGGTNAVSMRPPGVLATHFGEPSSSRVHEDAALAAGLEAVVLDLDGLAFDVDTEEDLAAWR
jgi:2-phospho-L-lactate/phosphoenolpyruvate guanylyltransferase